MARVKFRREELEEIGSYDEMEKVAFGDFESGGKKGSGRNSRPVPRK